MLVCPIKKILALDTSYIDTLKIHKNMNQNKLEAILYRNILSQTEVLPEVEWSSLSAGTRY